MVAKFVVKILIYGASLVLLQWLLYPFVVYQSFPELKVVQNNLRLPVEIVSFGSSVIKYSDANDKDKRSISQILSDSLIGLHHFGISGRAYQPALYLSFVQYIFKHCKSPPSTLVVEINLRAFSPEWDKRPQYQFPQEQMILEEKNISRYFVPLSIFKYRFNEYSQELFEQTNVIVENQNIGTVKEYLQSKNDINQYIKDGFLLNYMYSLDSTHRKIQSLKMIQQIADEYNVEVIFYITPIDYERGELLFPKVFSKIITQNIAILMKNLTSRNSKIIDLSNGLASSYFSYENRPTEHVNEKGKMFIAKKILNEITNK